MTIEIEQKRDCVKCGATDLRGYRFTPGPNGEETNVTCLDCADNENLDQWEKDKRLTGRLLVTASLKAFYATEAREKRTCDPRWLRINEDNQRLHAVVKDFEREVWLKGFGKAVEDDDHRSLKTDPFPTEVGEATLMTYTLAGRIMLTFDTKTVSFTSITAEHEGLERACMGVQGVDGTVEEAEALVRGAIRAYAVQRLQPLPDSQVTLDVVAAMRRRPVPKVVTNCFGRESPEREVVNGRTLPRGWVTADLGPTQDGARKRVAVLQRNGRVDSIELVSVERQPNRWSIIYATTRSADLPAPVRIQRNESDHGRRWQWVA